MRLVILSVLLAGCVHLSPQHPKGPMIASPASLSDRIACDRLDNFQIGWTATSVVAGVLGGGGGITTAVLDEHVPRYVTGSFSVFLSASAALAAYMSTTYTKKYTEQCTINTGGKTLIPAP
jgi:hypothetical protein